MTKINNNTMNIRVKLQDRTDAPFKTEIIDGAIVVTVVSDEKKEVNLFPKWDELVNVKGYYIDKYCYISELCLRDRNENTQNTFSTSDLAKAALATARVSQTYRKYRELVGEDNYWGIIRCYGLLSLAFRSVSEWNMFHESNKVDINLISHVENSIQLSNNNFQNNYE